MDDNIPDTEPEYSSKRNAWARPGEALPEVLDPVITKALIQQYVETERNRNRRALLWISGIFLFVVLLILSMFLSVGFYMLKKSITAAEIAEDMTLKTSVYAAEVVDMSNKLGRLEKDASDIQTEFKNKQTEEAKKEELLKSDLVRFSKWVSSKNKQESTALSNLERKLSDLEAASVLRQKELDEMREKYLALLQASSDKIVLGDDGVGMSVEAGKGVTESDVSTGGISSGVQEEPANKVQQDKGEDTTEPTEALTLSSGSASVVSFPNGDSYKGGFKNGLFSGWGVYTYGNGDQYEGNFSSDMKNGKGTFVYRNGSKYIGEFKNDMMEGKGTFYFNEGDRYVGDFKDNRMEGKGTRHYSNGNKYEGDFKNDMRHGNGILTFTNGDVYKGEFRDDERTGKGSYIFTDGAKYVGNFEGGQRHGSGKYIYAGGEEFVGEFRYGKREGTGICVYPNGQRLKGLWKNDEFVRTIEE